MNRSIAACVGLIGVAFLLTTVLGAKPSTTASSAKPTTKPVRSLNEVERTFATAKQKIEDERAKQLAAAEAERVAGLKALLARAMDQKDLESAVALRDKIKSAEAEQPAKGLSTTETQLAELSKLEKMLTGTAWQWGTETVQFKADGTAFNKQWSREVTTWKVIDGHTVLLYIQSGRDVNRYAILCFSPDFDSYSGYDFSGNPTKLPQNHRVRP